MSDQLPLVAQLEFMPDLCALAALHPEQFPCLLQSRLEAGWDVLFALPEQTRVYAADEGRTLRQDLAGLPAGGEVNGALAFLPFRGGWFCYVGYEWLETLEGSVPHRPMGSFPLAVLARTNCAIQVDRARQQAWILAGNATQLAHLKRLLSEASTWQPEPVGRVTPSEDDPEQFLRGVRRSKQYIVDGDVFQVNLSRGWDVELHDQPAPASVFSALRQANPAPFSALLQLPDGRAVVSSSPERLVQVDGRRVITRPIAGTHPRSTDPAEDAALKARLIASTKERAEHIMLIDLERNDLGRVCVPGSVKVEALMDVESYAFVHHIESTVAGVLSEGLDVAALLRALFPGGTITGCPKVRTMQIIRELEDRPRGAYTGSLGYINQDGSLDLNILIRTFMQEGSHLYFRAGAGIVADSDPERELNETRAKARGLLRALGVNG